MELSVDVKAGRDYLVVVDVPGLDGVVRLRDGDALTAPTLGTFGAQGGESHDRIVWRPDVGGRRPLLLTLDGTARSPYEVRVYEAQRGLVATGSGVPRG